MTWGKEDGVETCCDAVDICNDGGALLSLSALDDVGCLRLGVDGGGV